MSTYIVGWPSTFQPWHREGLTSFRQPYAANGGSVIEAHQIATPMKPQVDGASSVIVGGVSRIDPGPRVA